MFGKVFRIAALAATSVSMLCACEQKNLSLQIQTQAGVIEGIELENGVKAFLGVPFAEAPVGELRWQAPQQKESWDGVLETKAFANDPMQPDLFGDMNFRGPAKSEDCLYLNVWTAAKCSDEKLPVLIYFNGGGLMAGSGSEPRYDGAALALEGVVTVTANYREGVFGYFSHKELTAESPYQGSGNYGFLDQVAAIDWVKENIAAFGGDPQRINIVGESAGSFSVTALMVSPLAKNKIAGALLSSGAFVQPYPAMTQAEAEAEGAAKLAAAGIASLADAREMDAFELQAKILPAVLPAVVVDGYFADDTPDAVFARGEQAQVPLLAGWNSLEGAPRAASLDAYKAQMKETFGDMTDEIFQAFGLNGNEDLFAAPGFNLAGALFTAFPTWKVCDYHATTTSFPVYRYRYNHPRPRPSAKMGDMVGALAGGVREKTEEEKKAAPMLAPGAVHSADIEYAMGNLSTNEYYDWTEEDYEISRIFLSYYANFCKTGNPNGEGLPVWTPINGKLEEAPVMQIDVHTAEEASAALENAYRTLDRFYYSK
ncbi:MAG: carboxylesterase family protein [Bacteroidales bacterium]|nr:carboxylesterase family protein [Bacteroidales bacterium]